MCFGCWMEAGAPLIDNKRVRKAIPLIDAVYAENCMGGNLHCALDDWNLQVGFFKPKRNWTPAEKACGSHMAAMTIKERASALARRDGFTAEEAAAYEPVTYTKRIEGDCEIVESSDGAYSSITLLRAVPLSAFKRMLDEQ